MGSIKFFTSIIMVALFATAIIVYATSFASDNNSQISLVNDTDLIGIKDDMIGQQSSFSSNVNGSTGTFMSTTQDKGDQSASSGGQFKGGILTTLAMTTSVMTSGFQKIFGQDTGFGIFLTALSAILLFTATAFAWKYWKGNPD